jgi:hypothetical protein
MVGGSLRILRLLPPLKTAFNHEIGASLKTNDWNNNEHLTVRSSTTITENAVIIMEAIRCYRSQ